MIWWVALPAERKDWLVPCTHPSTIPSTTESQISIYMRKGYTPIGMYSESEVHAVVAWDK